MHGSAHGLKSCDQKRFGAKWVKCLPWRPPPVYIGSVLHIHGRRFEIISADERVLNYARERKIPLPTHTALSLRQYFKVFELAFTLTSLTCLILIFPNNNARNRTNPINPQRISTFRRSGNETERTKDPLISELQSVVI